MKTLSNFCTLNGLKLVPITYKHAASGQIDKRKGYDICNASGGVIASLEPCNDSQGNKWRLTTKGSSTLAKRVTGAVLSGIDLHTTEYLFKH